MSDKTAAAANGSGSTGEPAAQTQTPPALVKSTTLSSTLGRKIGEDLDRKPSPAPSLPPTTEQFEITSLGTPHIPTPLDFVHVVTDDDKIWLDPNVNSSTQAAVQKAGPRSHIYWDPETVKVGMVTCGGLCPALNNVIREVVHCLRYRYKVKNKVYGFKYGYWGIANENYVMLDENAVKEAHLFGGTIIGTSRGNQDPGQMVDVLVKLGINVLFTIGGDGTQRGASAIYKQIAARGVKISVIGIPKSIDNDIAYIDKTFGFETSVELAQPALRAAHEEARSIKNGVGLVKLMGRESGFIALHAALACGDVNMLLLPEVKFTIDDVLDYLEERFKEKDHALIVLAEGAGTVGLTRDALTKRGLVLADNVSNKPTGHSTPHWEIRRLGQRRPPRQRPLAQIPDPRRPQNPWRQRFPRHLHRPFLHHPRRCRQQCRRPLCLCAHAKLRTRGDGR